LASRRSTRPALAISLGCPAGIGPEVAVAAAAKARALRCLLVGDGTVVRRAARLRRVAQKRIVAVASRDQLARLDEGAIGLWSASTPLAAEVAAGSANAAAGAAQLAWIDEAADLAATGVCDGLVTAPVSKAAIATCGARGAKRFRGHTEHLARRLGAHEVVMTFAAPQLTVALVTTHLPIRRVARAITPERVAASCYWLGRMLVDLGRAHPKIAVAALNPHAGEGGLLGAEEDAAIAPGIARARRRLRRFPVELAGPIGAETAFRQAVAGDFDAVVAMYHDQATIASKLLSFGDAVNVTLGLPIVRTSVDHGTAYDLAGSGKASSRGMAAALRMAGVLSRCRPRG